MEGLRTGGRIRVNVLHGIIQCESRCKSHRVDQGEKGAETVRAHTHATLLMGKGRQIGLFSKKGP